MLWNAIKKRSVGDILILLIGYILLGFLVGAMFSEHISFQLAETNWGNLWTYLWLAFWPEFALLVGLYYMGMVGLVFLILGLLVAWWTGNL